jgi:enoyl-CoA hydratase
MTPAAQAPVLVEAQGRVLVITINREAVRNAVNTAVAQGIADALDELDRAPGLSLAVITGKGPTFSAGMDLKAFLAGERPAIPGRGFAGIVERGADKPIIAAVEGFALAGGFEIALACDLIVASSSAQFGLPEVKRGLMAAGGGLLRLPERIPHQIAMELALTGDRLSATRAAELGLVNRVTAPGETLDAALELAHRIAENGPLAVRATKRVVASARDWPTAEFFDRQREIYEPVRSSNDAIEGARAFSEKREPQWTAT